MKKELCSCLVSRLYHVLKVKVSAWYRVDVQKYFLEEIMQVHKVRTKLADTF